MIHLLMAIFLITYYVGLMLILFKDELGLGLVFTEKITTPIVVALMVILITITLI